MHLKATHHVNLAVGDSNLDGAATLRVLVCGLKIYPVSRTELGGQPELEMGGWHPPTM